MLAVNKSRMSVRITPSPHGSEYGLNEMGSLHAGLFRVVNRNLGRLIHALANVLARIFRGAIRHMECVFGAICGFYRNGLRSTVDMGNRAVRRLQPIAT